MSQGLLVVCRSCGRTRVNYGRRLCSSCHTRARETGTLIDFERATRSRDELLHEIEFFRNEGYTLGETAERLGMQRDSLVTAIYRARQAGLEVAA